MPLTDLPWWRWRARIRSALHMLSDPGFQQMAWLEGYGGYGDLVDAVYRLVEDSWLDRWPAEKYIGTIFRDSAEAAAVGAAVLRVMRVVHEVGEVAPAAVYLGHPDWPEAVRAAREAHHRLAVGDGTDPDLPPSTLAELRQLTAHG
ncbi:SCO4402 family protein [Kitasatospora sp. NPDC004531]